MEVQISDKLSFISEIFCNSKNQQLQIGSNFSSKKFNVLQLGSRFFASKNLILDAIYGENITGSSGKGISAGVAIVF